MNVTLSNQPVNTDTTAWHTVTLDDVLPMFGEGSTLEEARADLITHVRVLYEMLREDPTKLAKELAAELRFMDALRDAFNELPR